jgi:hypothetical protein
MNTEPMGKPCQHCGEPLISFSSLYLRICSGCRREMAWMLDKGQVPNISSSRDTRKSKE